MNYDQQIRRELQEAHRVRRRYREVSSMEAVVDTPDDRMILLALEEYNQDLRRCIRDLEMRRDTHTHTHTQ